MSHAPAGPPAPAAPFVIEGLEALEPRRNALVQALGGMHRLPGISSEELTHITELTHPKWRNPKGRYDGDKHREATLSVRRKVLAPMRLMPARGGTSYRLPPLEDHQSKVVALRGGGPRGVQWNAPYIDARGIETGVDPHRDALVYAIAFEAALRLADRRGVVLGVGSYHPAAIDVLSWPVSEDAAMHQRLARTGWKFAKQPIPFWVMP
ncbi:hypothetical protein [Roseomonas rosulenta]|uniref:hypothetical protein n=1 Tax=Roseomonas rosulenta TaxID=2748667 RepID=UPI0018DFD19C|nr:hypothetical protein [Roseomonas rosulenta]